MTADNVTSWVSSQFQNIFHHRLLSPTLNEHKPSVVTRKTGLRSVLLVRIAVGLIFLTQGILKYIDPNMGVVRFTRIGFPHPYFTAHLVGTFEVLCGLLVLIGLWTRLASIPLLVVITTAIASTKVPELLRANQGSWYMVSDARTDFAMFCCLIFLISVGGGLWSMDTRLAGNNRSRA